MVLSFCKELRRIILPICKTLLVGREGNLEQAASFTSAAWETEGISPTLHARDVLSEQYVPLVYHGGFRLAGTTQISASRAFVFAGRGSPPHPQAVPIHCRVA